MIQFIEEQLSVIIGQPSLLTYGLVLIAGLITSIGPCNLATVPAIIAYMGGAHLPGKARAFTLASAFGLGTAVTFTLLGILVSLVGGLFGARHTILYYLLGAICLVIGLLILDVLKLGMFGLVPGQTKQKGHLGAFSLGLTMGLAGSQCGTPVMLAILALAFAQGKSVYGASLLFTYAVGRAIPVILVGVFMGIGKSLMGLSRYTKYLEKAAGVIMLGLGLYFIINA